MRVRGGDAGLGLGAAEVAELPLDSSSDDRVGRGAIGKPSGETVMLPPG